jgi:transposase
MGRRLQEIVEGMKDYDFAKLAKRARHPREKMRFLGFVHFKEGKTVSEVSEILKVTRNALYQWLRAFEKEGLEGLTEKGGRGRKSLIDESEREVFKQSVLELQAQKTGGVIHGKDVLKMMEEKFGVKCNVRSAYNQLKRARLVWISSRSKHPNCDEEEQSAFKKSSKS